MAKTYRARIAGHLCIDLIPALASPVPGPGALALTGPLELRLGGCVANTGLALAALGAPVELVALLSDDLLGDAMAAMLKSVAVQNLSVRRISGSATSYSVVLQAPGADRTFLHHVGTNADFDGSEVPIEHTDVLHVGYPQLLPRLLDDTGSALVGLLTRARAGGVTTSVDFATVDQARSADYPWPDLLRRWLPLIDVLTPSLDDLWPAYPAIGTASVGAVTMDAGDAGDAGDVAAASAAETVGAAVRVADDLIRDGAAIAMVTAGRVGMCLRTAGSDRLDRGGRLLAGLPAGWSHRQLWAPPRVGDAVRTTGAGDTASAGFLYALLGGFTAEQTLGLATAAASLHVAGVDPLPRWGADRSVYDDIAFRPMAIDGWTQTHDGLLCGPADQKGTW